WQTLAAGLVATDAGAVVDCLTVSHGIFHGDHGIGQFTRLAGSFLTLCIPGVVFFLLYSVDNDGHEAVVDTTQFSTLTTIDAGLLNNGPGLIDETGDGVLLDGKLRHPPGVDHVVGGKQDANLVVDGDHHGVIHVHQVVLGFWKFVVDLLPRGGEHAEEGHRRFIRRGGQVFVFPAPLATD